MGTKTPLIKMRGNLIKVAKSMISEGLSVGEAEIKVPKAEKLKAAITIPIIKGRLIISGPIRTQLIKMIKELIKIPKITEAKISPKIIAQSEIGDETSLSKVLIFVSQGAITGVMAETEKKRAMPKRPGIRKSKGAFLLKEKEINKKAGISKP
jgi:hypothetical protein